MKKAGRIPGIVSKQCKAFIIDNKLAIGKYGILLNLAMKSYRSLPFSERDAWTLEEVVKQGL